MNTLSGREVLILQSDASLIDPHIWTDDPNRLNIRFAVYEPLVRYDQEHGMYRPALAEQWSLDDDARTWDFKLRSDVVFHNGDKLEARDVVTTLDRARDPNMAGELGTQGLYQRYLGEAPIEGVGKYVVRVVTKEPMADLLDILVEIPVVPRRGLAELPKAAVGTGPYRLVEATDTSVIVELFEKHWGWQPSVKRIHWRREPDAARRAGALLASEASVVAGVMPEDTEKIKSMDGIGLVTSDSSVCAVFMCNLLSGVCTDRAVRQALNYALDVPGLIDTVMKGAGRPLNGPLTPYHLGHDPSSLPYGYAPEKARALLADAGYGAGMQIVLDVPTTLPDRAPALAREMAEQYAELGIVTEVREFSDRSAYADMVRAKKIDDACCFDSSPLSTYRVLREKFHSGVRGPWWQGYENARVDEILDRAAATPDFAQRRELYRQAYRIIRKDAPWIFLFSPERIWGVSHEVHGFEAGADGVIKFS
jgi:peptide/nickel transport system substrate-binding protein